MTTVTGHATDDVGTRDFGILTKKRTAVAPPVILAPYSKGT